MPLLFANPEDKFSRIRAHICRNKNRAACSRQIIKRKDLCPALLYLSYYGSSQSVHHLQLPNRYCESLTLSEPVEKKT